MKTIGAVIVLFSAFILGVFCSHRADTRLKCCEELLRLMKFIREQVTVNKTPTKIIYQRAPGGFDLSDACKKGLYACCASKCTVCGKLELDILKSFSERVGRGDAEVQKGEFDYSISKLEELVAGLREKLPQTRRLSVSLFLFLGILIVILFI